MIPYLFTAGKQEMQHAGILLTEELLLKFLIFLIHLQKGMRSADSIVIPRHWTSVLKYEQSPKNISRKSSKGNAAIMCSRVSASITCQHEEYVLEIELSHFVGSDAVVAFASGRLKMGIGE